MKRKTTKRTTRRPMLKPTEPCVLKWSITSLLDTEPLESPAHSLSTPEPSHGTRVLRNSRRMHASYEYLSHRGPRADARCDRSTPLPGLASEFFCFFLVVVVVRHSCSSFFSIFFTVPLVQGVLLLSVSLVCNKCRLFTSAFST